MKTNEQVIEQTKKWINDVVIGCNFCPFAAREMKLNSIHYEVENSNDISECLYRFVNECVRLDDNKNIETSFLILPNAFQKFADYLDLVSLAEKLLKKQDYTGIYQVAGFHPLYCFADAAIDDASNYTNRSPYPMLHLLREERIEQALLHYPNPEQIPERNIAFARKAGLIYMKTLRENCF